MIIRAIFCLAFLLPVMGFSQSSLVTSGIVAYNNGDYELAISKFDEALKSPGQLEDKHLFKAHYYNGMAHYRQFSKEVSEKNTEQIEKHYDYLLKSYDHYKAAYKFSGGDADTKKVDKEVENILAKMIQMGVNLMSVDDYNTAKKYFDNCIDAVSHVDYSLNYMVYDLSGQNYLSLKDSTRALKDLSISVKNYDVSKPAKPDFLVGYTYYRIGLIHYLRGDDVDQTLDAIQAGISLVEAEGKRFDKMKADPNSTLNDDEIALLEKNRADALADLKAMELEVYLNYPEKYEEALVKFEKAVAADPKNETVLLAYGNLAEKTDPEKGYELYKKVLEINPDNTTALYNAGANRVNAGFAYAQLANETQDYAKSKEYEEKMKAELTKAYPFFKRCNELMPNDRGTIDALMQITITLEMNEEYFMYKEQKKALNGY